MRFYLRKPGEAWREIDRWEYDRYVEYEFDAVRDVLEGYAVAAVYPTPQELTDATH